MALPSSGAISFSQIVAEFGGVGSHSMSEYYPLVGQGVSGLPSSGQFSFSQFHGKDKDVVTSTWVTSGYNQTTLAYLGQYYDYSGSRAWNHDNGTHRYYFGTQNPGRTSGYVTNSGTSAYWYGTYRYTFGSQRWSNGNNTQRRYGLVVYQNQTSWVDTSGYVNVSSVASIST
jgi:hypothetical protein